MVEMLKKRINDMPFRGFIRKWLKANVLVMFGVKAGL